MKNWFETLNGALESEGLVETFPLGTNIGYGESVRYVKDGLFVSVYRSDDGRYERPISYKSRCDDFVHIIPRG